jgi:hypothetical protein
MVALWINFPAGAILWLFGLGFAWQCAARTPSVPAPSNPTSPPVVHLAGTAIHSALWQARYTEADARWDDALERWREMLNRVQFETRRFQFRSSPPWATLEGWYYGFQTGRGLGIEPLHRLRRDLEQAVDEYRRLCSEKAQAIARLKTERRNRQLNNFLDRFLIKSGSIPGIGPAKTVTLASFGIESAADISRVTIENIPGFGSATADKLLAWRATHERRFVYNPAPMPQDLQEQAKIEAEYGAKAGTLARQIAGSQAEMAHLVNTFRQRLAAENSKLGEIAIRRAQLEVDLAFLGISRPLKSRPPTPAACQASSSGPSSAPASSPPRPPYQAPTLILTGSVTCPQCGARMVRRTAWRGRRRGSSFWGCSRFPQCRGTRN